MIVQLLHSYVGVDAEIPSVNMYITRPPAGGPNNPSTAVVYATDVFGIQLPQNKL